jgi:hypothetical protein
MVFYRWTSYMKAKSPHKNEIIKIYHDYACKTLAQQTSSQNQKPTPFNQGPNLQ